MTDCTLVGSEEQVQLSFREKIEFCKMIDRLNLAALQLNPIRQKKIDTLLIKSICTAVRNMTVAVPVGLNEGSICEAWEAVKGAGSARLQVSAPVSSVQMEYIFHMKPKSVQEAVVKAIRLCSEKTDNIEFIAEDATRSDPAFLRSIVKEAITAGAKTITLSDTAGAMLPEDVSQFIGDLKESVPELSNVSLGFDGSNSMFLSEACAVAAIRSGAEEIKAAVCRADRISLPKICHIIRTKGTDFGARTDTNTEQMFRVANQISSLFGSKYSISDKSWNNSDQAENVLYSSDSREMVLHAAQRLGYDLNPDDQEKVWACFESLASKKDQISFKELDAIIAAEAMQVPAAYHHIKYTVNTDYSIGAMAHVKINYHDQELEGISAGDGVVDAAFLAIEKAIGRHYELDDFQIQAIAEGREAMGETIVKLRNEGKLYSGRGLSTDIVGSSIMAYLNALNKIVFEEEET